MKEQRTIDTIKDPYVLEFLDLPESHRLVENKLEEALITRLADFLLELGTGFAFVARQKRLSLDDDHYYSDLVFYHVKLKCYLLIDIKTAKLTHGDLGQMQMHVNYYDREIRGEDDNPTIGLILCTAKNDAMVKYVLDEKSKQIFASRYQFNRKRGSEFPGKTGTPPQQDGIGQAPGPPRRRETEGDNQAAPRIAGQRRRQRAVRNWDATRPHYPVVCNHRRKKAAAHHPSSHSISPLSMVHR